MKLINILSEIYRDLKNLPDLEKELDPVIKKRGKTLYKAFKKGKVTIDTSNFAPITFRPEQIKGEVVFSYELPDLFFLWKGDKSTPNNYDMRLDIPYLKYAALDNEKLYADNFHIKNIVLNKVQEKFSSLGIKLMVKPKFFRFNSDGKPIGLVVNYKDWDNVD